MKRVVSILLFAVLVTLNGVGQTNNQPAFTFDDVTGSLRDLTENSDKYQSLFDEPFFGFLKQMHDAYGTNFSLFCFAKIRDWKLEQTTDKYADEFKENSNWLKFGLHQGPDSANYKNSPKGMAKRDYKYFIKCMKTITGGEKKCLATIVRLHNFAGNLQACMEMKKLGVEGFLGADDSRNSYYLDSIQSRQLVKEGIYYDKEHNLAFYRTEKRLEKVKNIDEFLKRYDNNNLHFFTHEGRLLDAKTNQLNPSMAKKIEAVCKYLSR